MPVPDADLTPSPSSVGGGSGGGDAGLDHAQDKACTNLTPVCASNSCKHYPLITNSTPDTVRASDVETRSSKDTTTAAGGYEGLSNCVPDHSSTASGENSPLPPIEAVPLSSYYKLNRVPSTTAMSAPDSGASDGSDLKLPRRESITEMSEQQSLNGIHKKTLEHVIRTPVRQPSPQPVHLSVPGAGQSRVLHEEGSGYVAPTFEGKDSQMDEGDTRPLSARI